MKQKYIFLHKSNMKINIPSFISSYSTGSIEDRCRYLCSTIVDDEMDILESDDVVCGCKDIVWSKDDSNYIIK